MIAEELLDFRDEIVAGRQPLLIDHRLEPLDVASGVLVDRGCRVEPAPELIRFLVQGATLERDLEVPGDGPVEGKRGRRVRL